MTKLKKNLKNSLMTVNTGKVTDFFAHVKKTMRDIDDNKSFDTTSKTLTFEDPADLLHFLTARKLRLIDTIRQQPNTITNLAKINNRGLSAVSRDIRELEQFGLVTTHIEVNPGHGNSKIVELVASKLKLQAYI